MRGRVLLEQFLLNRPGEDGKKKHKKCLLQAEKTNAETNKTTSCTSSRKVHTYTVTEKGPKDSTDRNSSCVKTKGLAWKCGRM